MRHQTEYSPTKLTQSCMAILGKQTILYKIAIIEAIFHYLLIVTIITPFLHYQALTNSFATLTTTHKILIWTVVVVAPFFIHQINLFITCMMQFCCHVLFTKQVLSFSKAIRHATQRIMTCFIWNLYASTVGVLIILLQEILRGLPYFQKLLGKQRWHPMQTLVHPYLALHISHTNPVKILRDVITMTTQRWGESLRVNIGLIPAVIILRVIVGASMISTIFSWTHWSALIIGGIGSGAMIASSILHCCYRNAYQYVLYQFAIDPEPFSDYADILQSAFVSLHDENDNSSYLN